MPNKPSAKDITDDVFIAAVQRAMREKAEEWKCETAWCDRWRVTEILGFPEKVVMAKARRLIAKGRMDGCACGCRGDWDLRGKPDDPFPGVSNELVLETFELVGPGISPATLGKSFRVDLPRSSSADA